MLAEWKDRTFFAEVAETIGITTDQVMAVTPRPHQQYIVLFTKGEEFDPQNVLIQSVWLKRDRDDVLIQYSPVIDHPGMWEEILRKADEELPGLIERKLEEERRREEGR